MLIYLVERVSVKDTLVRARFPQSVNQKFNVLLFEHKINNTCLLQVLLTTQLYLKGKTLSGPVPNQINFPVIRERERERVCV